MLQPVEVIIDEAVPGHLFWTLVRHVGEGVTPLVVDFAMGPLPSREAALAAGNARKTHIQGGTWGMGGGQVERWDETSRMKH